MSAFKYRFLTLLSCFLQVSFFGGAGWRGKSLQLDRFLERRDSFKLLHAQHRVWHKLGSINTCEPTENINSKGY